MSPAGKGLTSWLLFVMFNFVFPPVVSWVRCSTGLYQFLIFATFLTLQYNVIFSVLNNKITMVSCPKVCDTISYHVFINIIIWFGFITHRKIIVIQMGTNYTHLVADLSFKLVMRDA